MMYSADLDQSDKLEKEKHLIKKEQHLLYMKIFMMQNKLYSI